ncbi:RsmB/NOP family class I SAM-dependent RNA methyltransferase [Primorskyibacter aestuariivivens]|uniref:RsmB/NOP family class I SAM-dependent RNA methyltransferase n=1 Tax=Primorskyibacter aestuariivivens TaxID=1888912 RepID=UPI00230136A4|nr:RsmB/NOP family class I SAM-dependent RNA methyltransferase [Primorskyibacter aestuariivivens]MDA7429792.1 RsmB/NOP family class I SAM-dependent RNA methyltransferase [Primorskyibacter aestuariivivens]
MTPAARIQSAAELLDEILAGRPAEQALTRWARGNRYAGSKDRAAVRDHVFDALRCKRSYAAYGGAMTGRGLMIGALRAGGQDPDTLFTGARHAPAPVNDAERAGFGTPDAAEARDLPDWLWPHFETSLRHHAEEEAGLLRQRADVFLRVNLLKSNVEAAISALAHDGVVAEPHPLSPTALRVTEGARRIHLCDAFTNGLVELQDAASQAVVDMLPLEPGMRVLEYCAGGGGKSLAMAARTSGEIVAHDISPERMKDIPQRAARAGARVTCTDHPEGVFDLVLCDAPCSGSGSWRRAPEAKWRLTPERLEELTAIQDGILDRAQALVAPGGTLAYATCSVLQQENEARSAAFLNRTLGWHATTVRRFRLSEGGDGFFCAVFQRD